MRAVIIYMSIHNGNTEKIGDVLAKKLDAKLIKAVDAEVEDLLNHNLLGFGSGIYFGRHHEALFRLLDRFPTVQNKYAFIFSTSALTRLPIIHDYHKALKRKMLKKGFKILGEFTCRGYSTHGPLKLFGGIHKGKPDKNDLEMASRFAEQIKENYLKEISSLRGESE